MTTAISPRGEIASGIALYAHLLRRAGFSANRAELEEYAKRPYEEVVEDLLHPENQPEIDEDLLLRYYPTTAPSTTTTAPAPAAGTTG